MKKKKSTQSKSRKRSPVALEKEQLSASLDPAELNRMIQQFDRAAPEKFTPELRLMTDEERKIYEHSN